MKTIAVYLGSSEGNGPQWKAAAREFGAKAARAGLRIVYGGANVGTMAALADGALGEGGQVTGVFPTGFGGRPQVAAMHKDIARKDIAELIYVKDFDERKATMMSLADCAVVLPGSVGTMDEAFNFALNTEIDLQDKPTYFLNFEGYYEGIKMQIAAMMKGGFMSDEEYAKMFRFFDTADELIDFLTK